MMISPEDRLALLEKQVRDLTARVNTLEYANMRYGGAPPSIPVPNMPTPVWPQTLPVTCNVDASWPFETGSDPHA